MIPTPRRPCERSSPCAAAGLRPARAGPRAGRATHRHKELGPGQGQGVARRAAARAARALRAPLGLVQRQQPAEGHFFRRRLPALGARVLAGLFAALCTRGLAPPEARERPAAGRGGGVGRRRRGRGRRRGGGRRVDDDGLQLPAAAAVADSAGGGRREGYVIRVVLGGACGGLEGRRLRWVW